MLRPRAFRANAADVEAFTGSPRRRRRADNEITAPTVVISGDADTVVYEEIHSLGLARDIPGAELVWVKNLGHKPDWIAPDLVVAAIEKLGGASRDLQAAGRAVEKGSPATVSPPACVATEAQAPSGHRLAGNARLWRQRRAFWGVMRPRSGSTDPARRRYRRCAACWWSPACAAERRP